MEQLCSADSLTFQRKTGVSEKAGRSHPYCNVDPHTVRPPAKGAALLFAAVRAAQVEFMQTPCHQEQNRTRNRILPSWSFFLPQ